VFYHFLARSFRFSDLSNASTLGDFSPLLAFSTLMALALITLPFIYLMQSFKANTSPKRFYIYMLVKISILTSFIYFLNTATFKTLILKKYDYINWSQAKTIKRNGRFTSTLYAQIQSNIAHEKLSAYKTKKIDVNALLFQNRHIKDKRDIYIVVLESFIDPRLIQDVMFDKSPLYEDFNYTFSYVVSPVYGGGTSQAEFELLTAAKALAKINSIDFNTLEGKETSGFVNILKQNNYSTYATIATNSSYFNSKSAYKSIGFDKSIFLEEQDDFHQNEGDEKIFDGDVYAYNMNHIQRLKKPFLHYTLGMQGHFPYSRNLALRPDIVSTTFHDKRVHKIANQFYYRTKALAKYIHDILAYDPHSIIYITSDHIPPLLTNGVIYTKEKMTNIALLLIDGKQQNIEGYHYHDIPRILYKALCHDTSKLTKLDTKTEEDIYFKILSESLQPR
jgi:phosphoglycerol transferase MdoB-like AlkP superfamily enzyme